MSFSLSSLITLALLDDYGSFTRAAEALGVTQPSVSQQVRELERVAGISLVQPRGRSIVLTPLGKELAAIGARVAIERDRAARIAADYCAGIAGRLVLAASLTTSAYVVPQAIARLQENRPDADVQLRVANTHDVAEMVANDVVDLGIVEGHVDRPELLVVSFSEDRLICVAPKANGYAGARMIPGDVRDATLLVREDGSGTREAVLQALDSHGFSFRRIASFGSNEAIKAGVANGLGIAWVPEVTVKSELEAGTLRELEFDGVRIVRDFSIVRRRDEQPAPLAQAFVDLLKALAH
ncbi:MAG TPA: LysR substrate-binding domain-containing protein [Candidatus Baltobacteraceae bacterium]|nr:LysR substrate-binding domain-containing protein [Candidatus Baltobacteraceae bacterium]